MGLSQALSTAMSGLRATQASISLVGSNVANAETPGYVRKTVNPGRRHDRRLRLERSHQRRQPAARSVSADPVAHRRPPARPMPTSARPFSPICRTSTAIRTETGTIEDAFNKLLTALPGPVDQPGLAVGADRCGHRRADDGAAAQRDDAGHSEPPRQRRDRHQRFRHHREQRDGPDRVHQQPAAEQRQDRRGDGVAARSARPVHHSAVAA